MKTRWHLITGEYPPQLGGVADYTRQLAQGLAAAGDDVIVWSPRVDRPTPCDDGVTVRRLPGHFGPAALVELDDALARSPGRIVLQYAPHAFGWKAMNVPLCVWLWARSRGLDVMFHEVAYPFVARQPLKHQLLAGVHRVMASLLLRRAERVFVSVPGWASLLRPLARRFPQPIWSPVPSNLPTELTASEIGATRDRSPAQATRLVGHFGTYSPWLCAQVESVMLKILAQRSDVGVLLLGRGSSAFADRIKQRQPELTGRLMGVGAAGRPRCRCAYRLLRCHGSAVSGRRQCAAQQFHGGAGLGTCHRFQRRGVERADLAHVRGRRVGAAGPIERNRPRPA